MRDIVIEKEKAIRVESNFEDFDGDIERWRNSFYTIWRYQLTWDFAYRITVIERRSGVYVSLLIKPVFKEDVLGMMEDLGYQNVTTEDCNVAFISSYDVQNVEDIILAFPERIR